jgi:protein gp37
MTAQFNPRTKGRGIEWCDETRNATGGCLHDCKWEMPDGSVAVCYAKELAESGVAKAAYPQGFEHHYWREHALKDLKKGKEPLLIFPDSMSDMFAHYVPTEQVDLILDAMRAAPHHTYQSLTKAPPQLLKYADRLPSNLWVGVSSPPDWFLGKRLTQKQQEAMLARSLDVLHEVKRLTGCIVWMSAEPVSWDLTRVIQRHPLDWIVIGAASSGPKYFQPDHVHIRNLLEVMDATNTPVFYKGNIRKLFTGRDLGTADLNRWREDFPTTYRDGRPIAAVARRQEQCKLHGWTPSRP